MRPNNVLLFEGSAKQKPLEETQQLAWSLASHPYRHLLRMRLGWVLHLKIKKMSFYVQFANKERSALQVD